MGRQTVWPVLSCPVHWLLGFLSKKHLLNSANTWFGAVITLLFGLVFVWGTTLDLGTSGLLFDGSLRSNAFILGIIVLLFYLPIYCGLSHFNSWISFLVFALEIATFAYYLAIEEPHRMTIRLVNGLRFITLAIASVQTCGDIYTVLHERAIKKQKRKEQRERQRVLAKAAELHKQEQAAKQVERARVAERRQRLPEEIAAMKGYSLNITPFISYLQTIASADLAYNRVANDLAHYTDTLLQIAAEKNIEAEELGVDSKVQIHTF